MGQYKITRDKFLSTDEVKRLLKVCEEQADLDLLKGRMTWPTRYMLVALALRSGLRVAEIAALKIGDLHLAGKETRLVVRKWKGGKLRDVYFNGSLTKPLKRYIEIKGKAWRQPISPGDYLFSHGEGKPFTTMALYFSFKKALGRAGLPMHHTIHHARHTFATHLLADTGSLKFVQKQLGHENIAHTALYADILPEQRQALADKLSI
jgi:site-specific recombinase XerD